MNCHGLTPAEYVRQYDVIVQSILDNVPAEVGGPPFLHSVCRLTPFSFQFASVFTLSHSSATPEGFPPSLRLTSLPFPSFSSPQIAPDMKFMGLAIQGHQRLQFEWYETFLNHSNHAANVPLDYASFHFYVWASSRTDTTSYEQFFTGEGSADDFLYVREGFRVRSLVRSGCFAVWLCLVCLSRA